MEIILYVAFISYLIFIVAVVMIGHIQTHTYMYTHTHTRSCTNRPIYFAHNHTCTQCTHKRNWFWWILYFWQLSSKAVPFYNTGYWIYKEFFISWMVLLSEHYKHPLKIIHFMFILWNKVHWHWGIPIFMKQRKVAKLYFSRIEYAIL